MWPHGEASFSAQHTNAKESTSVPDRPTTTQHYHSPSAETKRLTILQVYLGLQWQHVTSRGNFQPPWDRRDRTKTELMAADAPHDTDSNTVSLGDTHTGIVTFADKFSRDQRLERHSGGARHTRPAVDPENRTSLQYPLSAGAQCQADTDSPQTMLLLPTF